MDEARQEMRGGKRKGAGRKPRVNGLIEPIAVRVKKEAAERLRAHCERTKQSQSEAAEKWMLRLK
jgi:hypothetical protein